MNNQRQHRLLHALLLVSLLAGSPRQGDAESESPEPCSTPDGEYSLEDSPAKLLDPTATTSQLDVLQDDEAVTSLNELLRAAVEPADLPAAPDETLMMLGEVNEELSALEGIEDLEQYGSIKDEIYAPLELHIDTQTIDPAAINEHGGGGYSVGELFDLPD